MGLPPAMAFPFDARTTDIELYVGAACLRGWSFQESTNLAGASLVIYDGDSGAGQIVAPITLATNESTRDYPSGDGIMLRTSAFIEIVSGSVLGALWLTPLTFADDLAFAFGQSAPFYARHV